MTVYLVSGTRAYLEYAPGSTFEAVMPAAQEARAVARGALEVIEDSPVTLQPGTVRLANGWSTNRSEDE